MFKKRMKLLAAASVFFIIQFTFLPYVSFRGVVPDLLAILVVFYACYARRSALVLFAVTIGLAKDIFSMGLFGIEAVAAGCAAFPLYYLIHKFPSEFLFFRVAAVFCYVVMNQLIVIIGMCVFSSSSNGITLITQVMMPLVGYTVALAPLVLWLLKIVMKDSLRQYKLF